MRINNVNATNLQKYTEVKDRQVKQPQGQSPDVYSTNESIRAYSLAKQAINQAQDIRQDLVNDIIARIEDGSYHVSSDLLAEALLWQV